ncbi:MAG: hypothetical protein ACI9FU_001298 [Granulosicoccus sp.]|jgi:hypothetical protein
MVVIWCSTYLRLVIYRHIWLFIGIMSENLLDQFKLLHILVRKLSSSEISVLKGFLTAFESRQKGFKPKGLVLTELILKHDNPKKTLDLFRKKLGKNSLEATRVSVQRLRDKVYETFVLDINLKREGFLTESASDFSEIIKKRIQIGMLNVKGHRELTGQLYHSAIQQAQKVEKYADLIEMLLLYRQRFRSPAQLKEHEKITDSIHFYQKCMAAVHRMMDLKEDLFINFRTKGLNTTDPDGSYRKAVEKAITVLEKDFNDTASAVIGLEYYTLTSEIAQIDLKYKEANDQFKLMLDLLANNRSVGNRIRMMVANLNIAQNYIYQFKFDEAKPFIEKSKEHGTTNTSPFVAAQGQELYILLYQAKLSQASALAGELINVSRNLKHDEFMAKYSYYAAVCAFCSKEFKAARRFLLDTDQLLKDKQGFNVAIRVFNIILDIEGDKEDLADSQTMNLRQFMKEGLKEVAISKRDELILSILIELRKNSYDFKRTLINKKDELELLYSREQDYRWIPEAAEAICFHLWFDAKLNEHHYSSKLTEEIVHAKPLYNI